MNLNFSHFRWLWLPVLLAALLLIGWSTTATPTISAVEGQPLLLAFYYGWFDEQTWTSGLTPDLPLEPYRSSDPAVIARHVRQAREAGIEGFVMSWYGPQVILNQTETNFRMLLGEAQQQGFKAAVNFETRGPFFPDRDSVVAGLRYLLDTHAQHPAYLRLDGQPVVFFWQQNRFTVSEWENIRQEVDPDHTSLWIAEGTTLSYQFHFDGHHLYNIAWADDVRAELTRWRDLVRWFSGFYDLERYWVATIMPGFDERHLDRPSNSYRPRETGEFYIVSWQAAMATEPDMLIITSFNEWLEDSQIEPSVGYGNYYLDLTKALRNDEPFPPTPIPSPSPTPGRGSIIGLITDAATGNRLVGVTVSADDQTTLTDAAGLYRIDNVTEGLQVVVANFPGYFTAEKSRVVVSGQLLWNSIAMKPGADPTATSVPSPTSTATSSPTIEITPEPTDTPIATATATATATSESGSLLGLITNVKTGQRLAGAVVSAGGRSIQTQDNGFYLFEDLPPGPHIVSVEHPEFLPAQQTGLVVSNESRWNSIALTPHEQPTPTDAPTVPPSPTVTTTPLPTADPTDTSPPSSTPTQTATVPPSPTITATVLPTATPTATPLPTATPSQSPVGTLTGLVTDADTGERLADVTVSVADQSMVTDERGVYRFEAIPEGLQLVTAEKEGYQPGQKSRVVVANEVRWNSLKLAKISAGCPTSSEATFDLIPIQYVASNPHPDYLHGDLNLAQRSYSPTSADLSLQDYAGSADPNAPQLAGLFEPNSFPGIGTVYRVNHWDWGCDEHGCRGEPITDWPVTLIGLPTTRGQTIHIPERTPEIFEGEFKVMVLYAEEQRITLGYSRDDTVAGGYAVHIENVCVDPNLLALYRAQIDEAGFRATNLLPALRNNQILGTAFNTELQVAIRDRGAFLDPRSRKDWWPGF